MQHIAIEDLWKEIGGINPNTSFSAWGLADSYNIPNKESLSVAVCDHMAKATTIAENCDGNTVKSVGMSHL